MWHSAQRGCWVVPTVCGCRACGSAVWKGRTKRVTSQLKDLTNTTSRMMLKVTTSMISHVTGSSSVPFLHMKSQEGRFPSVISLPETRCSNIVMRKPSDKSQLKGFLPNLGPILFNCQSYQKQQKSPRVWVQRFRLRSTQVRIPWHRLQWGTKATWVQKKYMYIDYLICLELRDHALSAREGGYFTLSDFCWSEDQNVSRNSV